MTVRVNAALPEEGVVSESVARTVKVEGGPAVVGVPEITPVLAFRVYPAGKLPVPLWVNPAEGVPAPLSQAPVVSTTHQV